MPMQVYAFDHTLVNGTYSNEEFDGFRAGGASCSTGNVFTDDSESAVAATATTEVLQIKSNRVAFIYQRHMNSF